jgi:hypothetical protein
MMADLVYLVTDHGGTVAETRRPYASLADALAQARHDEEMGFGIPQRIESEDAKTKHAGRADFKKKA